MRSAEISMILDCGLTEDEKTKFYRMEERIAALFATFGQGIRLCEAIGEGDSREILFGVPCQEQPPIALRSARFLAGSDDEVLNELEDRLWCCG